MLINLPLKNHYRFHYHKGRKFIKRKILVVCNDYFHNHYRLTGLFNKQNIIFEMNRKIGLSNKTQSFK